MEFVNFFRGDNNFGEGQLPVAPVVATCLAHANRFVFVFQYYSFIIHFNKYIS